MSRIIAIPDIHGRNDLFGRLMNDLLEGQPGWPALAHDDQLVFLGDYIDRGLDSAGVIERLRSIEILRPNTIMLRGNHEKFLTDTYHGPEHERARTRDLWHYPGNGGQMTEASFRGIVPEDVVEWIEALPTSHDTPYFFFSHAPVPRDNRRPVFLHGQPFTERELIWSYDADEFGFSRNFGGSKVGVCGHIHQLKRGCYSPRFYPHYLFLDAGSGCAHRAPLIACDVAHRRYLSMRGEQGIFSTTLFDHTHEEVKS